MDFPKYSKGITSPIAILIGSIVIAIAILISGGIIQIGPKRNNVSPTPAPSQANQPQPPTITLNLIKDTFNKAFIKFGDANKKIIAIEISDPSCPYCQIAGGQNSELNKQAGDRFKLVSDGGTYVAPVPEFKKLADSGKASFVYLYFPGHGNGEMGTKAMYCAYDMGKFWQVHDLLMSSKGYDLLNNSVKNDKTKSGELAAFLAPVIDSSTMKACLDSGKYDSRLKEDMALTNALGMGTILTGTPGFYINTKPFNGAYNFKDMESIVNSALK